MNENKFRLEKQMPTENSSGFVRAISQKTDDVLQEVETSLDTDI